MSDHLSDVSFNRRHIFGPDRISEFQGSPLAEEEQMPMVQPQQPPTSEFKKYRADYLGFQALARSILSKFASAPGPQQPTAPEPQQSAVLSLHQSTISLPQQSTAPPPQNLMPDPSSGSSSPTSTQERCSIRLCIVSQGSLNRQHRINLIRHQSTLQGSSTDDKQLFNDLRNAYNHELRTLRQRYLSLRGLKYIAVLEYTERSTPARVEMDVFTGGELVYAFNHPDKITTEKKWVDWVFKLKSNPKEKYALEFVEGWKGEKILVLGAIPWFSSCFTAIIWSIYGDIQVAIAVASFILTASGSILALLAILSSLDG